MSGPSTRTVADRQTSIQIQTSAYGICLPVVYGTNRIGGNLVWFGNFQAYDHTTKTGGKGGSATNTTYTYSASAILALAEGTIAGIGDVWKDKDKTTLTALGLTLFNGDDTQAVWSFLSGYATIPNWNYDLVFGYEDAPAFVNQAINYSGTAYLCSSSYDLGESATIPNHSFEVKGKLIYSAAGDALPNTVISDVLTAQRYGLGFPAANVDTLTSYATYCQAVGLFISPAYSQARPGSDVIQELADATNAAVLWSGGVLKIIPYGDTTITGNGTTYTPNLTPLFDLADDDFLDRDDGPVTITRKTPADAYNRISVQFRNRANQYNQEVVSVEDQDAIEKYGLKVAATITCDFICESSIAKQVAQLALQRQLYKRNEYEFELGARYAMLEPMDIVTLTDPGLGMNRVAVRLIEVEETDDGFRCIAEDLPIGVAAAATYTHDNGLRWQNSTATPAQNCAAPVIFEMPPDQVTTGLAVAIAVGRQTTDKMYGGCRVWLSLDGVNYKDQGIIIGSSRYGTTTASLPAASAGIDSTSTLALSLRSGGQMLSGSTADLAKKTTLLNVGGEYLSYKDATLTGSNAYNLTTLNRGLYGTATGAKASGSTWVRVDDGVLVMNDLDLSMIGQTVYIKVCSFNVYGAEEQSLADVSAYTYTITGNMKALESPADLANAIVGQGDLATTNRAALPFGANALPNTDFTLVDPIVNPNMPFAWTAGWQGNSSNIGSLGWNDRRVALGDGSYAVARDITGTPNGTGFDCVGLNWMTYGRPRTALAVVPGDRVAVSALIGHQNCTAGWVVWFYYDENGVYLGEGGSATVAADIGAAAYSAITRKDLKLVGGTFTVPADGTYAGGTGRVRWIGMSTRFGISGSAANPRAVTAAPMMAKVPANQTAIPPYTPGDSDRQASYGAVTGTSLVSATYGSLGDADVRTANGTAAGIAGQAWAATNGSQAAVDNNYVAGFANQAIDSEFTLNNTSWNEGYASSGTWVWNYFTALQSKRFLERYCLSPTAGAQVNIGQETFCGIPVVDGDRLELSAIVSWANMSAATLTVGYFTAAGTFVTAASVATGVFDTRVGGFVTVPSGLNIGIAKLMAVYTVASAGTTASARIAQPFIRRCPSGQTVLSPYQPGPPIQRKADITGSNTAAAIAGQAGWATYTAYTPSQVVTPGANLIFNSSFNLGSQGWNTGAWSGPFKAAGDVGAYYMTANANNLYLYTADVTKTPVFPNLPYTFQIWAAANGTSSGSNRPYLYIDWHRADGSAIGSSSLQFVEVGVGYKTFWITGTSPADAAYARVVVNTNQVATGGGAIYTTKWKLELGSAPTPWTDDATNGALYQSGQTIDSLKPAQANADVTGSNVAAAIVGQGTGATASSLSALDPTAAATLASVAAGASKVAMSGAVISVFMAAGASLNFSGQVATNAGGTSGTLRCQLQSSPGGANSWTTFATGAGASVSASEPGTDAVSGTFTNSTGVAQVFDFRVNAGRTPGTAGGTVIPSQSFIST